MPISSLAEPRSVVRGPLSRLYERPCSVERGGVYRNGLRGSSFWPRSVRPAPSSCSIPETCSPCTQTNGTSFSARARNQFLPEGAQFLRSERLRHAAGHRNGLRGSSFWPRSVRPAPSSCSIPETCSPCTLGHFSDEAIHHVPTD
jgi:hypothetical protein